MQSEFVEPTELNRLRLSVCSIATNGMPVATGFFVVNPKASGERAYFLVTAGHVVHQLGKEIPYMMVAGTGTVSSVEEPCLGAWHYSGNTSDVCVLDITAQVPSLIQRGANFRCINVDVDSTNRLSQAKGPHEIKGTGVLQKFLFEKFRVGMVSECCSIGVCHESWEGQLDKMEPPLVCRSGRIAQLPRCRVYASRERNGQKKGIAADLFLTDITVIGGMSGAPVFVRGHAGFDQAYWYLAGVMVSQLPGTAEDEVRLLRADDAKFSVVNSTSLMVSASNYRHRGNAFLSLVVPYEEILLCLNMAEGTSPSVLDAFLR